MTEEPATQRELDILRDQVVRLDEHGSRGVGAVQVRLDDLLKDVVELRADMTQKFTEVDKKFERQRQERLTGRRWAIGAAIAATGSLAGIVTLLVEILSRIHG